MGAGSLRNAVSIAEIISALAAVVTLVYSVGEQERADILIRARPTHAP